MKYRFTFLIAFYLFFSFFAAGQDVEFCPDMLTRNCTFDPTQTVSLPSCVEVYQTLDGKLDGPIDSTRCFSGHDSLDYFELPLKQFDLSLPFFVVFTPSIEVFLEPNTYFSFQQFITTNDSSAWLVGASCADEICSGSFVKMIIPDSSGTLLTSRFHTISAPAPVFQNGICPTGSISACLASEYFDFQYISEVISKITINPNTVEPESAIRINNPIIYSDQWGAANYLTQIISHPTHQTSDSSFTVPLLEAVNPGVGLFYNPTIALYENTAEYPSPNNIHHIEARPFNNTVEPKTITLEVEEYQNLTFQPYVNIRGAYTLDSVTRHNFVLENNGADICITFIDLVSGGGSGYKHNGGQLSMNNPRSCMQFSNGGTLEVGKNATLHYGYSGMGMLVLGEGANVVLQEGSTLYIDSYMSMTQRDYTKPVQDVTMDLKPNTSLIFTENAFLTNQFSTNSEMHLNINMLGGTLDMSKLSAAERDVIRLIYPEPKKELAENWSIFPNPSSHYFDVNYIGKKGDKTQLQVFNQQGKLVLERTFLSENGINQWTAQHQLPVGMYILSLSVNGEQSIKVLAVME